MNRFSMKGVLLFVVLLMLLGGCSKKKETPCMKEIDCTNCDCIFEAIQKNLHNPEKVAKLRQCFSESNCK